MSFSREYSCCESMGWPKGNPSILSIHSSHAVAIVRMTKRKQGVYIFQSVEYDTGLQRGRDAQVEAACELT